MSEPQCVSWGVHIPVHKTREENNYNPREDKINVMWKVLSRIVIYHLDEEIDGTIINVADDVAGRGRIFLG